MITLGWARPLGQAVFRQTTKSRLSLSGLFRSRLSGLRHSPARGFTYSASLAMDTLPSEERQILDRLRQGKHDKWGWVVYRCTYNDDEGWNRFKDIITRQLRRSIVDSDTPEIGDSLVWTFVEDRNMLDNASKDQLRVHFKDWAAKAFDAENPRREQRLYGTVFCARYKYFIQIDEGALRSVVYDAPQATERDPYGEGYVNFVKADWEPTSEDIPEEDKDLEPYEPIERCCDEDVGWMKLMSTQLTATFYNDMSGFSQEWYCYYKRPPEIAFVL